jgi:hypothetical protein
MSCADVSPAADTHVPNTDSGTCLLEDVLRQGVSNIGG